MNNRNIAQHDTDSHQHAMVLFTEITELQLHIVDFVRGQQTVAK